MPRNLPHFTRCAAPGVASTYSVPGALLLFFTVGLVGFFIANGAGLDCGPIIIGVALGLMAFLVDFEHWFYNNRLMCILPDQCMVGTVTIVPRAACDGDNKIDTLIAPFGYHEVDGPLLVNAVNALAVPGGPLPAPGADINVRANRLAYVGGLDTGQAKLLYMELVHNHMLNDPARNFQSRMFRREPPPVMPQPAFDDTPDDSPGDPSHNPMFRYESDDIGGENAVVTFFCKTLMGVEDDEPKTDRLVPYMHCEIEGNRLSRGLTNLKISIMTFALTYVAACAVCMALTAGAGSLLCSLIATGVAALFSWLAWLISKAFNDPDEGSVENIPVDQADPTAADPTTVGARGDVVLIFGDWIKDTEHEQYLELHPIKSWFLICRDPNGAATTVDDPNVPNCGFDVMTFTRENLDAMCKLVTASETQDPVGPKTADTGAGLSVVAGIANDDEIKIK